MAAVRTSAQFPLVLVVDKDESVLRLARTVLEPEGFAVQVATSAEEALGHLQLTIPAVLILEVKLPGISGYDLCQIVRRSDRLKHLPVILLTTQATPREYRTGWDCGAVVFMAKPIQPEQLLRLMLGFAKPSSAGQ